MLEGMERNSANQKFNDLKKEISGIKARLNSLNQDKELHYKNYIELKNKISPLISELKLLKSKKDKSSINLKDIKEKRDAYNKEVKGLASKIKEMNSKKEALLTKLGFKFDIEQIKRRIDALEFKIETEVMSLDKEKQLMKEINKLRLTFGKSSEIKKVLDEVSEIARELNEKRKKANELHNSLQSTYRENKDFNRFIELSKEINGLRSKSKSFFELFKKEKEEFSKLNNELKSKLLEINSANSILRKGINEARNIRKIEERKKLDEMARQVEEKLRTKKKLTAEDLIIFRGGN